MKYVLVLLSLLLGSPALAQWQTSNHSVPIGRGAGVTGFSSAAPGTAGLALSSNGASADPTFQILPVAGGGTGRSSYGTFCVVYGNATANPLGCVQGTGGNSSLPLISQGAALAPVYAQINLGLAVNGTLLAAQFPALTGDVTTTAGSLATTLATVNANVGSFGSAVNCVTFTTNGKGLITAASQTACTPAIASVTGLGTGVATWLATPNSANLRAALTDETGTGAAVFAGGNIGAATATSLNGATVSPGHYSGEPSTGNALTGEIGEYAAAVTSSPTVAANVTITIASPAVITFPANPYTGTTNSTSPIVFTTSGALPTGLTVGTTYWIIGSSVSGNTFQVATSTANAFAGTAVNTSGTQSGTHVGTPGAVLTTATAAVAGAISLGAGDWDVDCVEAYTPANTTTVTSMLASLSLTAALDITPGRVASPPMASTVYNGTTANHVTIPPMRFSFSTTTVVNLIGFSAFTVAGNNASGILRARRAR